MEKNSDDVSSALYHRLFKLELMKSDFFKSFRRKYHLERINLLMILNGAIENILIQTAPWKFARVAEQIKIKLQLAVEIFR